MPSIYKVGNVIVNEVPTCNVELTSIFALCDCSILSVAASPSPNPFRLLVKYGSNKRDRFSLLMPQPRYDQMDFADPVNPFPFAITGAVILIFLIVMVVIMLIWIAWSTTFLFVIPLTFEHDLKPLDAIKVSARAGWGNFGGLIVMNIMLFLVGVLGMLMLCVGIFLISIPVTLIAHAVAYRRIFPRIQNNFGNMMPPPPSVYGDFGARPVA